MIAEIHQIGDALTSAQAELLCNIAYPVAFGCYFSATSDERALLAAGLIGEVESGDVPDATPLGRRVAEYVRSKQAPGDDTK